MNLYCNQVFKDKNSNDQRNLQDPWTGEVSQHSWSLPDRFFTLIRIPGSDDANECSDFGVLLHFHDSAFRWLKDGRLVYVWNADSHNGLVSEGAQVHKAWVDVLVHGLHHNVVCAPALKVQRLKKGKEKVGFFFLQLIRDQGSIFKRHAAQ